MRILSRRLVVVFSVRSRVLFVGLIAANRVILVCRSIDTFVDFSTPFDQSRTNRCRHVLSSLVERRRHSRHADLRVEILVLKHEALVYIPR